MRKKWLGHWRNGSLAGFLALALLPPFSADAVLTPAAPEFSVGSGTAGRGLPAVAWLPDHRMLATWYEWNDTAAPVDRMARVFEANGAPAGDAFALTPPGQAVITYVDSEQTLAVCSDGIFASAWVAHPDSEAPYEPRLQFFATDGTPVSPLIEIDDDLGYFGQLRGLECDVDGNAVLLWNEMVGDDLSRPILLARYGRDGSALLAPVEVVSSALDAEVYSGTVDLASDGSIVVGWAMSVETIQDNETTTGYVRRFDGSGTPLGPALAFESPFEDSFLFGNVGADALGRIYFAYTLLDRGNNLTATNDLYRFNLDGSGMLAASIPSHLDEGRVESLDVTAAGRVSVVWSDYSAAGYNGHHLFLQQYDENLALDGPDLQVGDNLVALYAAGDVANDGNGNAVVALGANGQTSFGVAIPGDALLRRFCSDDDASCALCNGETDNTDTDGDGRPDLCDPCTNVGGAQTASLARATVRASFAVPPVFELRENKVDVNERFILPAGTGFADLPVASEGLRLRIESPNGDAMVDVMLPGGTYAGRGTAGWTVSANRIAFTDRTPTPVNGFRKVSILRREAHGAGVIDVRIKGAGGLYERGLGNIPMKAILTLGGSASAQAGVCGESDFALENCEAETYGQWLKCVSQ